MLTRWWANGIVTWYRQKKIAELCIFKICLPFAIISLSVTYKFPLFKWWKKWLVRCSLVVYQLILIPFKVKNRAVNVLYFVKSNFAFFSWFLTKLLMQIADFWKMRCRRNYVSFTPLHFVQIGDTWE